MIEYLNGLSDRQLAFFWKYRSSELMNESKIKIQNELDKRNISTSIAENLMNINLRVTNENCPRCQSIDFLEIKDRKLVSQKYTAYEIEIISRKCRVCGYNPYKDKALNWKVRWKKIRGRYHYKRLV